MISVAWRRLTLAACVLVAIGFLAAAAGTAEKVSVGQDGWNTTPDYYANDNAFLHTRYTRGSNVRTSGKGKIHLQNATYDWQRDAYDMETVALLISGAEQPHWEITVSNGYSLEVYGDGDASQMLTDPGYWWTAEGKIKHHAEIMSEPVAALAAHFTIASFASTSQEGVDYEIIPGWGSQMYVCTQHSGTLSHTLSASAFKAVQGSMAYVAFKSTTNTRLKNIPFGPTQLHSTRVDVNQAPDAEGQTGNMGKWTGTSIAYDGSEIIDTISLP